MTKLDRTSSVPLYRQLREALVHLLAEQDLVAGDRLPGELELCQIYGVSRTVVRQALDELEREGVIERVKGQGTFCAATKVGERLAQSLTGLYEDMASRGKELISEVRRLEVVPATSRLAAELEIDVYQPVIVLERLRKVDDRPWALCITNIPYNVAPGLLQDEFTRCSLYALLEGKYGVRLSYGRRSIEATVADTALAEALDVPVGAAVLALRSVSRDESGRPVESFVAYHRGDRSRFEVDLERHPAGVPTRPLAILTDRPGEPG